MKALVRAAIGCLVISCFGCGETTDAVPDAHVADVIGTVGDVAVDAVGAEDGGLGCRASSDKLDLTGLYMMTSRLSFTFGSQPGGAVTVCPKEQTNVGRFLGLVRLEQDVDTQTVRVFALPCDLQLPNVSAVAGHCDPSAGSLVTAGIVFPRAFTDAVAQTASSSTLAEVGTASPGASFTSGEMSFAVGTRVMGDQAPRWKSDATGCGVADTLPGRSMGCEQACVTDCSKLADDDGDGWPGATVEVCGYTRRDIEDGVPCNAREPNRAGATIQGIALMNLLVQNVRFTGKAKSSCELAGTLNADIVYHLVGADLYVANTPISVASSIKSLPSYELNPEESTFQLIRVDGKHGTPDWPIHWSDPLQACRWVIEHHNEFP